MLKQCLFILLASLPLLCPAEILPMEGSRLNFRLVGFSFPREGAVEYTVEVAEGDFSNPAEFARHIVLRHKTERNGVVLEMPAFGKSYTWRAYAKDANGAKLCHFSTVSDDRVNARRLRILQSNRELSGKCIIVDGSDLVYDAAGKLLAFLPQQKSSSQIDSRNISVTKDSTLTFLDKKVPREISLAGHTIWQAPLHHGMNRDTAAYRYHHEIVKMPNGHYMVMGEEYILTRQVRRPDTSFTLLLQPEQADTGYTEGIYSTLIEFDKAGNIVWSWEDSKRLLGTDYDYYLWPDKQSPFAVSPMPGMPMPQQRPLAANVPSGQFPPPPPPPDPRARAMWNRLPFNIKYDPHANSFYVDKEEGVIYISYRNINRIIKVAYPSGEITAVYGQNYKPGMQSVCGGMLCNQHAVKKTKSGDVCFFNNNSCNSTDSLPSIIVLDIDEKHGGAGCRKQWEYVCSAKNVFNKKLGNGGNVKELEDGSFFVSLGWSSGKLFVVNRDKQETWSAQPEVYFPFLDTWFGIGQYRAEMIDRAEMESLVWKAEKLMTKK